MAVSRKKKETTLPSGNPLDLMEAACRKNKELNVDEDFVKLDPNLFKSPLPHLPTGSVCLDSLIGGQVNKHGVTPCPGLPRGRLTQLYGWNSSGKTTVALTAAATTAQAGGTVLYVDYEYEIDPTYASAIGVPVTDPKRFRLVQPDTLEHGFIYIYTAACVGVDLIVIDSVGSGVPQASYVLTSEQIAKGETGRLGQIAAAWSDFLRRLKPRVAVAKSAVLGLSQMRQSGPNKIESTVQGGEAWKFYSAVRILLRRIAWEKGKVYDPLSHSVDEKKTGAVIRAKLDKCKVSSSQGHEQDFYLVHGKGIDDVHSILDIAINHKVAKKAGTWISWEENKWQGIGAALKHFQENREDFEKLYRSTIPHLTNSQLSSGEEEILVPTGDAAFDESAIESEFGDLVDGVISGEKTGLDSVDDLIEGM